MFQNAFKLILLIVLAAAAIAVMFFLISLVFRLLIIGAIAFVIFVLIKSWNMKNT